VPKNRPRNVEKKGRKSVGRVRKTPKTITTSRPLSKGGGEEEQTSEGKNSTKSHTCKAKGAHDRTCAKAGIGKDLFYPSGGGGRGTKQSPGPKRRGNKKKYCDQTLETTQKESQLKKTRATGGEGGESGKRRCWGPAQHQNQCANANKPNISNATKNKKRSPRGSR